jgi:pyruvate/2-oxoglutarate dehydrogenase complex dihydrolipoamide acyltransferase (E2) component
MPIRVEAYTAGGVATGVVARSGPLREALDDAGDLLVERAQWLPLVGSGERSAGEVRVAVDDLLLLVSDEAEGGPVHAQWHTIELVVGPYLVVGEMPTMPGFDPGRALARPSGEFVFLREARIALVDQADGGEASAPRLLVNRYTVDRVKADLMLGFFFPGAEMVLTGAAAAQAAAAAVAATTPEPAMTAATPAAPGAAAPLPAPAPPPAPEPAPDTPAA